MNIQITFTDSDGKQSSFCATPEEPYNGKYGQWTPYGHICEYPTYYEYASWACYYRIDKLTMQITTNAAGSMFKPVRGATAHLLTDSERDAYYSMQKGI
ncbi:hypothetical protein [Ethanoligenens sp.]|uniref:hypothetical protein n=1 Tax=Ethanoligenens sp. TaxID=2099655 RepID=UPI0039E9A2D0